MSWGFFFNTIFFSVLFLFLLLFSSPPFLFHFGIWIMVFCFVLFCFVCFFLYTIRTLISRMREVVNYSRWNRNGMELEREFL